MSTIHFNLFDDDLSIYFVKENISLMSSSNVVILCKTHKEANKV